MQVDFGRTASDYGSYRTGFPAALFERLAGCGIGRPGQRIVDLGSGTGNLARGLALRGAAVIGLDIAPAMLAEARRLDAEAGVAVDYRTAPAEATGLPGAAFDAVTAGQCWHWFDGARAAAEARRLLRPGGRLVTAHFDWLPLPGNLVEATEQLIGAFNPDWTMGGGSGLHPAALHDAAVAGFVEIETFSFDRPVLYSHAAWRGRIRASAGVGGSLPPEAVAAFDAAHAALLAERFPDEPQSVPHRVFAMIAQAP